MKAGTDYMPASFEIKGSTSRSSTIDSAVTVSGGNAQIREGKQTRAVSAPKQYFTIAGYAPVSMQTALLRYWRQHGSPVKLATFPSGEVQIADRGTEAFTIDGKPVKLERYSIRGLVWGLETVWMDNKDDLAALVTRDAEFDHFEAIGTEYEAALKEFVSSAGKDEMVELPPALCRLILSALGDCKHSKGEQHHRGECQLFHTTFSGPPDLRFSTGPIRELLGRDDSATGNAVATPVCVISASIRIYGV